MHPLTITRRVAGPLLLAFALACSSSRPLDAPAFLAVADAPAIAPPRAPTPVERIVELGRRDNRAQEHLRHLSLEIGPRLTSSHNIEEAEEWARDQLASFGLDARLERWSDEDDFPVGFDRGPWSGGMLAPERVEYDFTTMAWSAGTGGLPRRGRAVLYPSTLEELEARRPSLAGAWVVRPPRNRGARGEDPEKDVREAVEAALDGAGIAGEVRGTRGELVMTMGSSRIKWEELPTKVAVYLRGDQHEDLVKRLGEGQEVELEFQIDNRFFRGPVPQFNVVADWRGTELADEVVIVCGHLDSWDGAQGTIDNGTGCATTLEAARLIAQAGVRAKRTLRFILWSGEEQGLLGSMAYVKQHPELKDKISAVFNHDEGTNYLSGLTVTHEMLPAMQEACAPVRVLNSVMPFELTASDGLAGSVGSDHDSFVHAGIPGFFWQQSGRSDYNRYHHTQHDNFDAAIPEYQEHSAIVAAVVAFGVADLPAILDRTNMEPIQPRRMGVQLDENVVREVMERGKAKDAGWQAGDVLLAIDGVEVSGMRDVIRELQAGGPRKVVRLRRGEEVLETVLDYGDDPNEERRAKRAAERAARANPEGKAPEGKMPERTTEDRR